MPRKNGNYTTYKPLESPTCALDEGEEMRKDIYDLQRRQ
jgi:hypothetical protein